MWAQCFKGHAATLITCYTCSQPGHVATDCAHTDQSFFVPPGKQPHLPVTSSIPLRANPKSAVSSMLVDAKTKPHLACANTDMNVPSTTTITLTPRVPARAPINKHKPNTPLQPEVLQCHYTITLIVCLLNHCFGHYIIVSILATLVHVTFVYLPT